MQTATLHAAPASPARELRHLDQQTQDRLAELGATLAPVQALKRTGRRPLLFNGQTIATLCGVTPALPFWYELNVHRTVIGSYVTDVRLFHKSPDHHDLFWVEEHDEMDGVVAYLERYDPSGDISVPREMATRAGSAAELALRTARLQMQVDAITQHYRALVGELLHTLSKG